MADAEREIRIVISGKNMAGPEFEKARQSLLGVKSESAKTTSAGQELAAAWGQVRTVLGAAAVATAGKWLIDQAKGALAFADELVNLSNKTGIGIEALQRYKLVAEQGGTSLDTFTGAIFRLGTNLVKGTAEVRASAEALGLPYERLKAMKPEQQFDTVAVALSKVDNVQERNRLGLELFGKSAGAIIPGIVDGYVEWRDSAVTASDEAIRALDRAGDRLGKFEADWNAKLVQAMGSTLILTDQMGEKGLTGSVKAFTKAVIENWDHVVMSGKSPARAIAEIVALYSTAADVATSSSTKQQAAGNVVVATTKDWVAAMGAAKAEVAALTKNQRAQIAAALEAGASASDLSEQFDLSKEALVVLRRETQATADRQRAHAKAMDEAATSAAKLRAEQDRLFGRDKIAEAKALVDLIGGLPNTWQLTDDAASQSLKTLTDALTAYQRLGIEAPANVRLLADALKLATQYHETLSRPIALVTAPPPDVPPAFSVDTGGNGGLQSWLYGRTSVQLAPPPGAAAAMAQQFGTQFMQQLGPTLIGAFQGGGNPLVSVGAMGGQQLGKSVVEGFSDKFASGFLGKTLSSILPGIGALAGPLVGKLVDAFTGGQQANRLRDSLKEKFGDAAGEGLAAAVDRVGSSDAVRKAYDRFLSAGNKRDVEAAFKDLTKAMDEADAVMRKYGLSLDDTKSPQDRFATSSKALAKDMAMLKDLGFSTAQSSKAMAKELNDLVRAALDSGGKLPASMRPYLEELARGGLLADDLQSRLLGLPEKTKAPWREMQAIAEEFGIDLEALGPKFKESKLIEGAEDLAKKWELLVLNGADVNAVVEGMSGKANEYLKNALKWGIEIPASMKPMLEKMLEAGKLTDENGDKLESLEGIQFGKTAAQQLEPLVDALNNLVEAIRDDLPGALDDMRANASRGITIPVRYETSGTPGPDDDDGDGIPNQYDNYPGDPTQYASGGIASGRQFAMLAERPGQKEIVGDVDFMTRALARAIPAAFGQASGAVAGSGRSEPATLVVQVNFGTQRLDEKIVDVTATAMAKGQIPVPQRAVQSQVSRW